MNGKPSPGLFVTATDTGVGKTYVAALVARQLAAAGARVGVYKPVASGCDFRNGCLTSDDAVSLCQAAGRSGDLDRVCPQRFAAPLAPHLAAQAEARQVDADLLWQGLAWWTARSDVVIVEGVGGLMSPVTADQYVADLACQFGFPLLIVARNALGTIHQTLATLLAAAAYGDRLAVAGVVLNNPLAPQLADLSCQSNPAELARRCAPPLLAEVAWRGGFDRPVDWMALARRFPPASSSPLSKPARGRAEHGPLQEP